MYSRRLKITCRMNSTSISQSKNKTSREPFCNSCAVYYVYFVLLHLFFIINTCNLIYSLRIHKQNVLAVYGKPTYYLSFSQANKSQDTRDVSVQFIYLSKIVSLSRYKITIINLHKHLKIQTLNPLAKAILHLLSSKISKSSAKLVNVFLRKFYACIQTEEMLIHRPLNLSCGTIWCIL